MAKKPVENTQIYKEKDWLKIFSYITFFLFVVTAFSLFGTTSLIGNFIFDNTTYLIGVYSYLLPVALLIFSYLLYSKKISLLWSKNGLLINTLLLIIFTLLSYFTNDLGSIGGVLGSALTSFLNNLAGMYPSIILLILGGFASILGLLNKSFDLHNLELSKIRLPGLPNLLPKFSKNELSDNLLDEAEPETNRDIRDELLGNLDTEIIDKEKNNKKIKTIKALSEKDGGQSSYTKPARRQSINLDTKYERPPLSLYEEDSGKPSAGDNKQNSLLIRRTMQNFGISVEMDEVSVGPTVTRYCLKPAQGVKLSRIAALDKNLAMELSTTSVRIEAPVPGKSVVGIEIPNKVKAMIGIGTMFADSRFQEDKRPLLMAIGKDIAGDPTYADLAKMPHLLVAGMTGAGKSAMIHSLIHSLVYRNAPDELKFIMIDPKKVELSFYQKLPHLYTPVIKEPKKAVQTLNWLVHEMERRYEVLEENSKQNITGYHALVAEKYAKAEKSKNENTDDLPERMPYIVVVIDELADFMMAYPKEMESGIVRLAQKSRAVGIHLILSTQKPLASIVSSVIKANVPGRIALKVASRVDSMVILDQIGAEKLLGQGDLLLISSDGSDSKRIQSPYISEKEITRVIDFLKTRYTDYVPEDLVLPNGNNVSPAGAFNTNGFGGEESNDDRFEEAKEIVLASKNASTTFLQRKMGVGYARAAKLIDALEANGIIGPANGSKPREILVGASAELAMQQSSQDLEDAADELLGEDADSREDR